MKREKPKMYIVRKYVKATSIANVLRRERDTRPHDIFVDESWKDANLADAIGFAEVYDEEEEYDG